jgi:hypothetical protein
MEGSMSEGSSENKGQPQDNEALLKNLRHEKLPDTALTLRSAATLEEYKTLRQEILNHQQFTHQINTAAFTAGGLVAAVAAVADPTKVPASIKAFTLLLAWLIFFGLIRSQISRRRKIYRIGRYIQYVIEHRVPGLHWESSWSRQKDSQGTEERSYIENLPLLVLQTSSLIGGIYFLRKWLSEREFPERMSYSWLLILLALAGALLLIQELVLIKRAEDLTTYQNESEKLSETIDAAPKT